MILFIHSTKNQLIFLYLVILPIKSVGSVPKTGSVAKAEMKHFWVCFFFALYTLYIVHMYRWWVGSSICQANHCGIVWILPDSWMDNILVYVLYTQVIPTGLYATLCQEHVQAKQTKWRMFEEHMLPALQLWHIAKWPLKCDYTKKCDQIETDRCRTKWSCNFKCLC